MKPQLRMDSLIVSKCLRRVIAGCGYGGFTLQISLIICTVNCRMRFISDTCKNNFFLSKIHLYELFKICNNCVIAFISEY